MRRTAAEAAETRQRLLDAATLALAERGYDGTTFAHVADRIGMTRGAVHHHFRGGKDELVTTLLTEQWARYGERVLAPLRADQPAERALRTFLTDYLALLATDELFRALATVTTLVAAHVPDSGAGLDQHRRSLDGWRSALRAVLDGARLRPGVTVDAAVFVVVSMVLGANDTAAIEPDRLPDGDERRSVVEALVGGLLVAEGGGRERGDDER